MIYGSLEINHLAVQRAVQLTSTVEFAMLKNKSKAL